MIIKKVEPIIDQAKVEIDNGFVSVIGYRAEYRIFGILLYRKLYYSPTKFGVSNWRADDFRFNI